jgi:hypothetical protein
LAARSDKDSRKRQTGGGIKGFVTGKRDRSPEKDAISRGEVKFVSEEGTNLQSATCIQQEPLKMSRFASGL